jgi:hypothetical protein
MIADRSTREARLDDELKQEASLVGIEDERTSGYRRGKEIESADAGRVKLSKL